MPLRSSRHGSRSGLSILRRPGLHFARFDANRRLCAGTSRRSSQIARWTATLFVPEEAIALALAAMAPAARLAWSPRHFEATSAFSPSSSESSEIKRLDGLPRRQPFPENRSNSSNPAAATSTCVHFSESRQIWWESECQSNPHVNRLPVGHAYAATESAWKR